MGIIKCDPQSAFRAERKGSFQEISGMTKILFPSEIFDLNDEYNPTDSTFVPKQAGVYTICSTVHYNLGNTVTPSVVFLSIIVSNNNIETGRTVTYPPIDQDTAHICTIVQLQEGDMVEVFMNTSSVIVFEGSFSAARFPSPE